MSILSDSINHNYLDTLEEVDVIVMLVGRYEGRMAKTAELYKDKYAENVIFTPVIVNDAFYQSVEDAVRHGIPESQLILEYDAAGTYTNAAGTMALMRAHGSHPQLS